MRGRGAMQRGRGGGGGRGRGRGQGASLASLLVRNEEVDPERLAQSVAFVDVDTVTRQFVPGVTEVMAVAKPFASSKVYNATGETHVPRCEGQNTAQNLQAALALMYRNASSVLWNAQIQNQNQNPNPNNGVPNVNQRRPTFLSVPIWMAQNVAVVGTVELLIHTVDPVLRHQVWLGREGGGAGFITFADIERHLKQQQALQALNNAFGQGSDNDDDDNDEEKKDVDNSNSNTDLHKAKLLLSLTPLEAANYVIHGGVMSALDPGCNATACSYVNQTLFGLKRHYFLYAGVDAPTEQKVDLDVPALFSLPNALTILFRRSEAHSIVCSAANRDIRTAVDLVNAVYEGPLPPSEDKARQLHNQRAVAIANEDAEECAASTLLLKRALEELKAEQQAYAMFAERVRQEAGKGLVPQFRLFTSLVRDLFEDIRLTQLDPAKLIRAFLPLNSSSLSATSRSQQQQGIELKNHMFAQRDFFKESVVDPIVARLPEIHVSSEAHEQFRRARRMLFPTALAILGKAYPEPMPECLDVLRELQPLTLPINVVLSPMVSLETCDMTPSDNLLMRLCRMLRGHNLDANAASWAVTCMQLLLSTAKVKDQARENFVLSGGHAAGKSYTLKELVKLLFGADLMTEVRTATSQKSGENTIYPQVNDEAESGVASIWELLKRRGMFGVYDTSNETRDRKATMSQQSVTYSKNDFKDPVTGQSRNKKQRTVFFADNIGTTNFPALLGTDQAVTSRERDANPLSSLGTTETHITWLPDAYDKAHKIKAWGEIRRLNFMCFFGFHCRAMGLYQPHKSDMGLMIGHAVTSSVTHISENAFGSLFSSTSNSANRSDMENACMIRLRDNLESTNARSLMFQFAEMVPDADETLGYYQRRRLLDQIVDALHEGLPAIAFTRNDSVSLLTQRDTRYIRALIETLEYQSAMLSVFNNNAAGANYTQGSFFDRMQILEDAHCDQTVENVIKGLQSCSWLDVRIIDGARALLALYCQISAQELSPLLPDNKGIVIFRNFFAPVSAETKSQSQNHGKGNEGARDTRIFYFFRRLNQVFARPIWETKTANEMLMLLMFVRVVGNTHPLLDYRDFDDKSDNLDLHLDIRVVLYGHFASMINNKISVLNRPIECLGFHATLERRSQGNTFRCSPTVYSLEPRAPNPDTLPANSMWRQRVTREILFRENKSWLQQRIIDETRSSAPSLQRRSVSVPLVTETKTPPLVSPKRAFSDTSSTIHGDDEDVEMKEEEPPAVEKLVEDCMEDLEAQIRTIELEHATAKNAKTKKSMPVFVQNGNNFQELRLQPNEEIPLAAAHLLDTIEKEHNPRACYVFQRLIRVSHVPITVRNDEEESPEYKLAGTWRTAFHKIEFSPSQRLHFSARLDSLHEKLRTEANDKITEVNRKTKTLAARISRLASHYSVSQPLYMGMASTYDEVQWLRVEHIESPFAHFPPVKAHDVWRNVILERTRYAHYSLNNSQLVYEKHGLLLDADLREREREQRFRRLYPDLQIDRLWCDSSNLRLNQRCQARILELTTLLEPIFKFHAATVCDDNDDEALYFHGTLPVDALQGKDVRRVFTHAPHRDSAHFLCDVREATAVPVYVVIYKRLLWEALMIFFDYMRWRASLQGLLCVTVDADLCHYTAESLGLVYCTRIIDLIAQAVTSPQLVDADTESKVSAFVTKWIDEVIFEYKGQRDEAVDRFTLNQLAVSQLPFSLNDLRRGVFVPAYEDFSLTQETIVRRFAPYIDFVPIVSVVPHVAPPPFALIAAAADNASAPPQYAAEEGGSGSGSVTEDDGEQHNGMVII